MNMERYYKILGISNTASKKEIKQAYLDKIKMFHPDKVLGTNLENTANFLSAELNEAYKILITHFNEKTPSDVGKCNNYKYDIWNGACYGMSINEIKKLFPNGCVPKTTMIYDDGARVLYMLEEYELVNNIFEVRFVFRAEKLISVNLSQKLRNNKNQSEKVFSLLKQTLTAKYGNEINSDDYIDKHFIKRSVGWLSPSGINISLLLMVTGSYEAGHVAGVHLTYWVRQLSDELNLQDELHKL